MDTCGVIYKIINILTNKTYVGKSGRSACKFLQSSYHGGGVYIKAARRKYGPLNFTRVVIEECSLNVIDERERFWIKELNTLCPNGYNILLGGEGGCTTEIANRTIADKRKRGVQIGSNSEQARRSAATRKRLGIEKLAHVKRIARMRADGTLFTMAKKSAETRRKNGNKGHTAAQAKKAWITRRANKTDHWVLKPDIRIRRRELLRTARLKLDTRQPK